MSRRAQARRAPAKRTSTAANAGAAFLSEETLSDHYGIDLTAMIARLPEMRARESTIADRLRRAALRAIDRELAAIRAEASESTP